MILSKRWKPAIRKHGCVLSQCCSFTTFELLQLFFSLIHSVEESEREYSSSSDDGLDEPDGPDAAANSPGIPSVCSFVFYWTLLLLFLSTVPFHLLRTSDSDQLTQNHPQQADARATHMHGQFWFVHITQRHFRPLLEAVGLNAKVSSCPIMVLLNRRSFWTKTYRNRIQSVIAYKVMSTEKPVYAINRATIVVKCNGD